MTKNLTQDKNNEPVELEASANYSALVEYSRAGERFHHVWAAAQSLKLLDARSRLQALWIEGAGGGSVAGDEIIDVAEYYGPGPDEFDEVVVRQLKYSTTRAARNMGLSDLGPTLRKFAQIDSRASQAFKVPAQAKARYVVVTNRPISPTVTNAFTKIMEGRQFPENSYPGKLLRWLQLNRDSAIGLLDRIEFASSELGLQALRSQLDDLTGMLTGETDATIPSVLIEQVSKRASGETATPIRLETVAASFGVAVDELVPAPSLLSPESSLVGRERYKELAEAILAAERPVIMTAVGGAGKSTFARQLPELLADRATVIVYDCFGNGSYRASNHSRHRHRDGLVQITSELAARALCPPLIPRPATAPTEYLKAFRKRLAEAALRNAEGSPGARIVILVDAADNAAAAAHSTPGEQPFVSDLLRLEPVENVSIILTCRPYRVNDLNPPPGIVQLELPEFSLTESARMLRLRYPAATENDVEEFHRRTSANPRIQALSLEQSTNLGQCLEGLAGIKGDGGDAVEQLLDHQLGHILDAAGADRDALEFTGQLLASLRPRIPIHVLASLTERDGGLIRSFVSDLGRGLLVDEDSVQFLDEPTETFFRTRYALNRHNAERVVATLADLSATSPYAAGSLPQVLWEAGLYPQLVELARADSALPDTSEVERRQIAELRTAFALRAAIKLRRPEDIVGLALRAGVAAASGERRYKLLRNEPDLAGEILDSATLDELRAARAFPSDWPGAVLGAESVMLAMHPDRQGEGRNRLRAARAALHVWLQTSEESVTSRVEPKNVADIALAAVYLHEEGLAARYLESWRPARWILEPAGLVAATLLARAEHHRAERLGAASQSAALSVAVAAEQERIGLPLTAEHAQCAWETLRAQHVDIDFSDYSLQETADKVYRGIAWVAACAVRCRIADPLEGIELLNQYLPTEPPNDLGDRYGRRRAGMLHAYALRARLSEKSLTLPDLQPNDETADHRRGRQKFEEQEALLEQLLPWLNSWANWSLGSVSSSEISSLLGSYPKKRSSYRDPVLARRIAGPIAAQLARATHEEGAMQRFREILRDAGDHSGLFVAAEMIACLQGDDRYSDAAYACASAAADACEREQQPADQMAEELVRLARSIYAYDSFEARQYFERAVAVVSRIGDDGWQRWTAIVAIGRAATLDDERDAFRLAAHLAHVSERIKPYLDDSLDEGELALTIRQITGSRSLGLLSQWRDRRFGSLEWLLGALTKEPAGLFEAAPHLSIALASLSARIPIGPQLAKIHDRGELTDRRFTAARDLARARGIALHAGDTGDTVATRFGLGSEATVDAVSYDHESSRFANNDSYLASQASKITRLRERLHDLNLSSEDGMLQAAEAIADAIHRSEILPLIEEMKARPVSHWAGVTHAFRKSDQFTPWQRASFLGHAIKIPSNSQAFRGSVRALAKDFLAQNGTNIMSGHRYEVDLEQLAGFLDTDVRGVCMLALESTDATLLVSSAESCYRLAGAVAPLLTPGEAVFSLKSALADLEQDLEIEPWSGQEIGVPTSSDVQTATAAFLWSALADPRASIRWRATHAVRFLFEYGDDSTVNALCEFSRGDAPTGYTDRRFPFYRMHAVEALLAAAERASLTHPGNVVSVLPAIRSFQAEYPDHVKVQRCSALIGKRSGDNRLADQGSITRKPSIVLASYQRPGAPKPFTTERVTSEFNFHFDLDEYWLGPLTNSFEVEHADVLEAVSDVILDEWGWRGSPGLTTDPRRAAGAYLEGETYFYKYDFPKAEDLDFYLSYHAMLTVAGRLLRCKRPYQEPEDDRTEFDRWYSTFDLSREDRLWLADARRTVPQDLGHSSRPGRDGWLWDVTPGDFVRAFLGTDGWITVGQSAHRTDYGTSDNVIITSALVDPETGPALVRTLQSAPSFNQVHIPLDGDENFTIDSGIFRLRGWIEHPDSEGGLDRRDEFAADIRYPTPRPAKWVQDRLGLSPTPNGLDWLQVGKPELVAASEAWSEKVSGREPRGPDGARLRVRRTLVEDLATATDNAVIIEVRFDRNDESTRRYARSDDSLGYLDDYVKFFLFTPNEGWSDYRGDLIVRQADRRGS
jgi:hypothetical protein